MSIPENVLVSQKDAAIIQIEEAIRLYHEGNLACALTLAGAAEGCLGPDTDTHPDFFIFQTMKEKAQQLKGWTQREAVNKLNMSLYFLKHYDDAKADARLLLQAIDPWIMIVRASAKLQSLHPGATTPKIGEFNRYSVQYAQEIVDAAMQQKPTYPAGS